MNYAHLARDGQSAADVLFDAHGHLRQQSHVPPALLWCLPVLHPADRSRLQLTIVSELRQTARNIVRDLQRHGDIQAADLSYEFSTDLVQALQHSSDQDGEAWARAAEVLRSTRNVPFGLFLGALRFAAEAGSAAAAAALIRHARPLAKGWSAVPAYRAAHAGWPATGRTLATLVDQTLARFSAAAKGADQ